MTKFRCRTCGFKFEYGQKPKKCPYCSKETIDNEETADDLIKDVDKIIHR